MGSEEPGKRVVAVGEMLAEFVANGIGSAHEGPGLYRGPFPSGAPAIFIDQVARSGAPAVVVGAVGADGFGRGLRARLEADGVDCTGLATDPFLPTGVAFVAYATGGGRDFIFQIAGTAAAAIPARPVPGDAREVLHVSGSSLGLPTIRDRVMATARAVLEAGGRLSLDPNVRKELFLDPEAERALRQLVAEAAILLPSLEDVEVLWPGLSAEAAVDAMLAGGAKVAAVKRGAHGALVADAQGRHDLAPHAVAVVDPTGAGDCFCGTLVARIVQGDALALAARRANAAGAMSVRALGPMEGNPTLAEIDAFLASSDLAKSELAKSGLAEAEW